jgi:hypothetical protein
MIIGSGSFWGVNQLAYDYTGKSIYTRSNERWARILAAGDPLPEKARQNKALMDAERARREAAPSEEQRGRTNEQSERGLVGNIWMGGEREGWRKRRLQEEREALESGKGYGSLIMDYIRDAWHQGLKGRENGEQTAGETRTKRDPVESKEPKRPQ